MLGKQCVQTILTDLHFNGLEPLSSGVLLQILAFPLMQYMNHLDPSVCDVFHLFLGLQSLVLSLIMGTPQVPELNFFCIL